MGRVRVTLTKQQTDFHFRATNETGHQVNIDDATAYEVGHGNGVGPMQLLVMALGGCSGVDIMLILNKGKQPVESFEIEVVGEKPDGASPSTFNQIHVHFSLEGDISVSKVRRAVELSMDKYCSVARTLEQLATISWSFSVNGERFDS